MYQIKILLTATVVLFNLGAIAQKLTDEQIVDKHIPAEMLKAKILLDPPEKIDASTITKIFKTSDFGSKDGSRYIMVIYSTLNRGGLDNPMIEFLVIKVSKNGTTLVLNTPKSYDSSLALGAGSEMELFDLDNDGVSELVMTDTWGHGHNVYSASAILKWSGTNLENITPLKPDSKSSQLTELQLEALPLIIYEEYVESKGDEPSKTSQKVVQLTSTGFVELATYDFLKVISKETKKN